MQQVICDSNINKGVKLYKEAKQRIQDHKKVVEEKAKNKYHNAVKLAKEKEEYEKKDYEDMVTVAQLFRGTISLSQDSNQLYVFLSLQLSILSPPHFQKNVISFNWTFLFIINNT